MLSGIRNIQSVYKIAGAGRGTVDGSAVSWPDIPSGFRSIDFLRSSDKQATGCNLVSSFNKKTNKDLSDGTVGRFDHYTYSEVGR